MFTEEHISENAKGRSKALFSGEDDLSVAMASVLKGNIASALNISSIVYNEAKLDDDSRPRLYSRRSGCCDAALFARMKKVDEQGG